MKRVALFVLLLCLFGCGKTNSITAVVIEKSYTPSTTATGVGPSFSGRNGGVAIVTTVTAERYTLFLQYPDGHADPTEVNKNLWLQAKIGDVVDVKYNTIWGVEKVTKEN